MPKMIYTTLNDTDTIDFRWKPIPNTSLYRILVESSTGGIVLDLIRNKSDFVNVDGFLQFQFRYDKFYPETPAFIPRIVRIGTYDKNNKKYIAQVSFILLSKSVEDNLEILGNEIEESQRKDFESKLRAFLSSTPDSLQNIDNLNFDDGFTFSRGLLCLDLQLQSDSNFLFFGGTGPGGFPPPPRRP